MAIELISKIKPKNGASYPMVDAADVEMPDGSRLSDFHESIMASIQMQAVTPEFYEEMRKAGTLDPRVCYLIVSSDSA